MNMNNRIENNIGGRSVLSGFLLKMSVLLFPAMLLGACDQTLEAPELQPFDAGVLSASLDEVVIDPAKPGEEAVTFTWTSFPSTLIQFTLELKYGDLTEPVVIPQNAAAKKFTNAELNNILVKKFGLPLGVPAEIQAIVHGAVTTKDLTDSTNPVTITVTPAAAGPAYNALWMVGNATPDNWNINSPTQMTVDPSDPFQFRYLGELNAGEFKIPVSTGNWGTDYFMPLVNNPPLSNTGVQLVPGGNPDYKWKITTAGTYKVVLNISANPSMKIAPFTPYAAIFIVGDATPAGWSIDNPEVMIKDANSPYIFTWTGPLKAGEFKFPLEKGNWNGPFFMAPQAEAPLNTNYLVFTPGGGPDNKFKLSASEAGTYRITVNQLLETISIVKQ